MVMLGWDSFTRLHKFVPPIRFCSYMIIMLLMFSLCDQSPALLMYLSQGGHTLCIQTFSVILSLFRWNKAEYIPRQCKIFIFKVFYFLAQALQLLKNETCFKLSAGTALSAVSDQKRQFLAWVAGWQGCLLSLKQNLKLFSCYAK